MVHHLATRVLRVKPVIRYSGMFAPFLQFVGFDSFVRESERGVSTQLEVDQGQPTPSVGEQLEEGRLDGDNKQEGNPAALKRARSSSAKPVGSKKKKRA